MHCETTIYGKLYKWWVKLATYSKNGWFQPHQTFAMDQVPLKLNNLEYTIESSSESKKSHNAGLFEGQGTTSCSVSFGSIRVCQPPIILRYVSIRRFLWISFKSQTVSTYKAVSLYLYVSHCIHIIHIQLYLFWW